MQKESIKFQDSLCFEGMTSIRAIIEGIDSGVNDRRISTILCDKDKTSKIAKTLGYLKAVSSKYNFNLEEADAKALEEIALGNSHGGIIAICKERSIPTLTEEIFNEENDCCPADAFCVVRAGTGRLSGWHLSRLLL